MDKKFYREEMCGLKFFISIYVTRYEKRDLKGSKKSIFGFYVIL